eukprot:g7595.t1
MSQALWFAQGDDGRATSARDRMLRERREEAIAANIRAEREAHANASTAAKLHADAEAEREAALRARGRALDAEAERRREHERAARARHESELSARARRGSFLARTTLAHDFQERQSGQGVEHALAETRERDTSGAEYWAHESARDRMLRERREEAIAANIRAEREAHANASTA